MISSSGILSATLMEVGEFSETAPTFPVDPISMADSSTIAIIFFREN